MHFSGKFENHVIPVDITSNAQYLFSPCWSFAGNKVIQNSDSFPAFLTARNAHESQFWPMGPRQKWCIGLLRGFIWMGKHVFLLLFLLPPPHWKGNGAPSQFTKQAPHVEDSESQVVVGHIYPRWTTHLYFYDSQKYITLALIVWLSWLSVVPQSKKVPVTFLVRTHAWVAGSIPVPGVYKRKLINASLSHWYFSPSLSPYLPFSVKINK